MEAADHRQDDQIPLGRRGGHRGQCVPGQCLRPPGHGPRLLPGPGPVGSRRPSPVGALGRAVPGPRHRHRPAFQGALPPQVADGPADPRARPGSPGAAGQGRVRPAGCRRTAARRRGHRARPAVHRGRPDPAPRPARAHASAGKTWAHDPGGGKYRDLGLEEHKAFWTWAAVQVLATPASGSRNSPSCPTTASSSTSCRPPAS